LLALSIVLLTLHISDLRLKVFALISLPLSIVVIANFVPTQTIDRLETIPTELATGTLGERSQAWEASWEIFAAHPVLGVGAGASRFRIEPRLGREQGPHNTYLSIGADLGTVGLGLFLLLLLSVAARWLSLQGRERQVVGVLLITLMVGLLPGHLEYRKVTWVVIAIIISEAARAQRTALYRLPARKVSIP
jgi:O-antigen ligase